MPSILPGNATSSVPQAPAPPGLAASGFQDYSSSSVCHGLFYDAFLVVPSALFVLFLGFHAKKNLRKLCSGRSHVIISYYAILWVVCLLNLAWCLFQTMQCSPGRETAWNLLSLFTTSGLLYLEISLVAFILQGNYINGLEALSHTFLVTGVIVGADILLKAIYVFGFGVPLFINVGTAHCVKWSLWSIHKIVLTAFYALTLFVRFSKWREELPPRPAFYKYIMLMFIVNLVALLACLFAGFGASFGVRLYSFIIICYHSLYLPFLYVTFLADFFKEEDFLLDNAYYAEMKDAVFFDADWD